MSKRKKQQGDKSGAAAIGTVLSMFAYYAVVAITGYELLGMLAYMAAYYMFAQMTAPEVGFAGLGTPDEIGGGGGGLTGGQPMNPVANGEVADTASAGSAVPVVYGTRKIAGNFIYFNDFAAEHHEEWRSTGGTARYIHMSDTPKSTLKEFYENVTGLRHPLGEARTSRLGFDIEFGYMGTTYVFLWAALAGDYLTGGLYDWWEAIDSYHDRHGWDRAYKCLELALHVKQTIPGATVQTADYYTYSSTWALSFCRGPVDKLWKVYRGDRQVGAYTMTPTDVNDWDLLTVPSEKDERLRIPVTYGAFYWGGPAQVVNSYIAYKETVAPRFKRQCYVLFAVQSTGVQTVVPQLAIEVSRWPAPLTVNQAYKIVGTLEANPIYCVLDLLVNTDYGLSVPASQIDITSFNIAAQYIYNTGKGYSNILNTVRTALDWIGDILAECRAYLYYEDNQYHIRALEDLEDIDEDSLDEMTWHDVVAGTLQFSRQAWDATFDTVVLTFIDRKKQYERNTYKAFNSASAHVSDYNKQYSVVYPGLCRAGQASKIAFDLLRRVTYPIASVTLKTTRKWSEKKVGDLLKFSYEPYSYVGIFRVVDIREDDINSNQLAIKLIQEPVPFRVSTEWDPDADWVVPTLYTFPDKIDYPAVVQLPQWLLPNSRMFATFAGSTNALCDGYSVYASVDEGVTYRKVGEHFAIHSGGHVIGAYPSTYPNGTYDVDDLAGVTLTMFSSLSTAESVSRDYMYRYTQLGYNANKGEWLSVGDYSISGLTQMRLLPTIRHVGGGDPKLWDDGNVVFVGNPYLIAVDAITDGIPGITQVAFKLLPRSVHNVGDLSDAVAITVATSGAYQTPLPACNLYSGDILSPTNYYSAGDDILLQWRRAAFDPGSAGLRVPLMMIPGATNALSPPGVHLRIYNNAGNSVMRNVTGLTSIYNYAWADNQTDHGAGGGDGFKVEVSQVAGLTTEDIEYRSIWRGITMYKT